MTGSTLPVTCQCGHRSHFTSAQAGSLVPCPRCDQTVEVPSLAVFQQRRQDPPVRPRLQFRLATVFFVMFMVAAGSAITIECLRGIGYDYAKMRRAGYSVDRSVFWTGDSGQIDLTVTSRRAFTVTITRGYKPANPPPLLDAEAAILRSELVRCASYRGGFGMRYFLRLRLEYDDGRLSVYDHHDSNKRAVFSERLIMAAVSESETGRKHYIAFFDKSRDELLRSPRGDGTGWDLLDCEVRQR